MWLAVNGLMQECQQRRLKWWANGKSNDAGLTFLWHLQSDILFFRFLVHVHVHDFLSNLKLQEPKKYNSWQECFIQSKTVTFWGGCWLIDWPAVGLMILALFPRCLWLALSALLIINKLRKNLPKSHHPLLYVYYTKIYGRRRIREAVFATGNPPPPQT